MHDTFSLKIPSARLACAKQLDDGEPGGARQFADILAQTLAQRSPGLAINIHAVGHSAGSILHCHLLPVLYKRLQKHGVDNTAKLQSLAFLAPACRVDLFKRQLLGMIVDQKIVEFSEFTMNASAERDDNVAGIYRQSLLYLVQKACERGHPPILGLEDSIVADSELLNLFGLPPAKFGPAQIVFGPTARRDDAFSSTAEKHADFDNDAPTMNAVLRRILRLKDTALLPSPMLPQERDRTQLTAANHERNSIAKRQSQSGNGVLSPATAGNRLYGLCIGIDDYPTQPLQGCVADAKSWQALFESYGAIMQPPLYNRVATKAAVLESILQLLSRASAGDLVLIQYAGHGTQVPDFNNDELDNLDEAWVTIDFERGHVLLDDEIGGLIDRYTPDGVKVVLFTDCCHSASITRAKRVVAPEGMRSRLMPLGGDAQFVNRFKSAQRHWSSLVPVRRSEFAHQEIHFAACQDDQSAYEVNGAGQFTVSATRIIKELPTDATYFDLSLALNQEFSSNNRQKPNLNASKVHKRLQLFSRPNKGYQVPAGSTSGNTSNGSEPAVDDLTVSAAAGNSAPPKREDPTVNFSASLPSQQALLAETRQLINRVDDNLKALGND